MSFSESNYLHHINIYVGNTSDIKQQTWCGGRSEKVHPNKNVTIQCEKWGQYVSIRKYDGPRKDAFMLCEVLVMGYKYRGKYNECYYVINVAVAVNQNIVKRSHVFKQSYFSLSNV